MSAPRIRVIWDGDEGREQPAVWWCKACPDWDDRACGEANTLAAAADAGRAHIRQAHAADRLLDLTLEVKAAAYCRTRGRQCDECGCGLTGPNSTRVASEYPSGVKVAQSGAGNLRTGDYGPLLQAHNGSRADA